MFIPSLLVLDIDGTILDEGYLPPHRAQAVRRISQLVPTVMSTGRAPESIETISQQLELSGPHATTNGATIVTNLTQVEVLHQLTVPQINHILEALISRGQVAAVYKPGAGIFTTGEDPRFDILDKLGERDPIHHLPDNLEGVAKILTVVRAEDEGDLREILKDETTIQRTHELFLEWNAKEASKGAGLLIQAEHFGIDPSKVVAVGDSENDISMFKTPAYGIAVQNAHPAVKAAAQEVLTVDFADYLNQLADAIEAERA